MDFEIFEDEAAALAAGVNTAEDDYSFDDCDALVNPAP